MKKKIKLFQKISLINQRYKKNELYHYFDCPDVSIVIPLINKKFLLVSQRREPINKVNYEFPSGWVDKGEAASESAARELFEETGYKSLNNPKKLLNFFEEPGRMNSKAICFYTKKLIKINKPEKEIKIHLCTKKEIFKLIKKDKFNNASHIAAFYFFLFSIKI